MRRHAWNCDLSTKPGTDILTNRHMDLANSKHLEELPVELEFLEKPDMEN